MNASIANYRNAVQGILAKNADSISFDAVEWEHVRECQKLNIRPYDCAWMIADHRDHWQREQIKKELREYADKYMSGNWREEAA